MRRNLNLDDLDAVVSECRRLLQGGYLRNGNWSLGQVCSHMRMTIDANMHGYPAWMTVLGYPLRPLLRRFGLPMLLAGRSPAGIKTAPRFVPPDDLDDAEEVAALAECVDEFHRCEALLHPHPGFGRMDRERFERFHAAHAAHHLGFLADAEPAS